mmetsp:Transcript_4712/g.17806  ORF Transcript_4712/g.17806 Transcript_4712/m.17806 type:complete len:237 (+) Transcript_4712:216-926(+)
MRRQILLLAAIQIALRRRNIIIILEAIGDHRPTDASALTQKSVFHQHRSPPSNIAEARRPSLHGPVGHGFQPSAWRLRSRRWFCRWSTEHGALDIPNVQAEDGAAPEFLIARHRGSVPRPHLVGDLLHVVAGLARQRNHEVGQAVKVRGERIPEERGEGQPTSDPDLAALDASPSREINTNLSAILAELPAADGGLQLVPGDPHRDLQGLQVLEGHLGGHVERHPHGGAVVGQLLV